MKRLLIAALLLLGLPAAAQTLQPIQVGASTAVFSTGGNRKLVALTITTAVNAVFVSIIDDTVAPSAGTITPKTCFYVASATTIGISFPIPPLFRSGIVGAVSSVGCGTYTADTTAFVSAEIQ